MKSLTIISLAVFTFVGSSIAGDNVVIQSPARKGRPEDNQYCVNIQAPRCPQQCPDLCTTYGKDYCRVYCLKKK